MDVLELWESYWVQSGDFGDMVSQCLFTMNFYYSFTVFRQCYEKNK